MEEIKKGILDLVDSLEVRNINLAIQISKGVGLMDWLSKELDDVWCYIESYRVYYRLGFGYISTNIKSLPNIEVIARNNDQEFKKLRKQLRRSKSNINKSLIYLEAII